MRAIGAIGVAVCMLGFLNDTAEARGGRDRSIGSATRTAPVTAVPTSRAPREARDAVTVRIGSEPSAGGYRHPDGAQPTRHARTRPGAFNGVYSRSDGGGAAVPIDSATPVSAASIGSLRPEPVSLTAVIEQPKPAVNAAESAPAPRSGPAAIRILSAGQRTYALKPCRSKAADEVVCLLH